VTITITVVDRTERLKPCPDCGGSFPHVTGFVERAGKAHAVYFTSCHDHDHRTAWIDVVLGTWGVDPPVRDHTMFSCGLRSDGAMVVDAPVALDPGALHGAHADPTLGRPMTRQEALAHDRITAFWAVVDAIAVQDPAVAAQVYGTTELPTRRTQL
jgi:hypothetical protein